MNAVFWMRGASISLLALAGFLATGCGKTATTGPQEAQPAAPSGVADDHSQWWCAEHSAPEEICAQCNAKVAAEYQKKGDWCQEHNRPESQCFICSPKRAEKFAAQYEARFGTKPPHPEANE